jgi:hypothetical protein
MKRISLSFGRSIPTALACYWYLGRRWRYGTVAGSMRGVAVPVRTLAFVLRFDVLSSITALEFTS